MDSGGPWWKVFEGVFRGFSTVSSSAGPEQSPGRIYGANFAKMLVVWWTNKKHSVLISVLQNTQWINSELMSKVHLCLAAHVFCFLLSINLYSTWIVSETLNLSYLHGNWAARHTEWIFIFKGLAFQNILSF